MGRGRSPWWEMSRGRGGPRLGKGAACGAPPPEPGRALGRRLRGSGSGVRHGAEPATRVSIRQAAASWAAYSSSDRPSWCATFALHIRELHGASAGAAGVTAGAVLGCAGEDLWRRLRPLLGRSQVRQGPAPEPVALRGGHLSVRFHRREELVRLELGELGLHRLVVRQRHVSSVAQRRGKGHERRLGRGAFGQQRQGQLGHALEAAEVRDRRGHRLGRRIEREAETNPDVGGFGVEGSNAVQRLVFGGRRGEREEGKERRQQCGHGVGLQGRVVGGCNCRQPLEEGSVGQRHRVEDHPNRCAGSLVHPVEQEDRTEETVLTCPDGRGPRLRPLHLQLQRVPAAFQLHQAHCGPPARRRGGLAVLLRAEGLVFVVEDHPPAAVVEEVALHLHEVGAGDLERARMTVPLARERHLHPLMGLDTPIGLQHLGQGQTWGPQHQFSSEVGAPTAARHSAGNSFQS